MQQELRDLPQGSIRPPYTLGLNLILIICAEMRQFKLTLTFAVKIDADYCQVAFNNQGFTCY